MIVCGRMKETWRANEREEEIKQISLDSTLAFSTPPYSKFVREWCPCRAARRPRSPSPSMWLFEKLRKIYETKVQKFATKENTHFENRGYSEKKDEKLNSVH